MEVVSNGGCGDVRAKWKSVTEALRSMQANLAELERQLTDTLAIVESELEPGPDTVALEAVASTESEEPSVAAEVIDELAVIRTPENGSPNTDDVAPVNNDLVAPEVVTNEKPTEPQSLFATPSPTTAKEGLAEQEASSADTDFDAASSAVSSCELSDAEALSVPCESNAFRTDGDCTKLDAQPGAEGTVAPTEVEATLNAAAAGIGSIVEAVPTQPKTNVGCFSGRRWLRPLAASAAACLTLLTALIMNNPDALAALSILGRLASDR